MENNILFFINYISFVYRTIVVVLHRFVVSDFLRVSNVSVILILKDASLQSKSDNSVLS